METILYEHYGKLLGLESPWQVSSLDLQLENQRVEIGVSLMKGSKVTCPVCKKDCTIADHAPERTWRHLDTMQFETILRARVPRSACPECGVKTIAVSWAEPGSRFTLLFEAFAVHVLQVASSIEKARDLLGLSWKTAQHIMDRAVERGLSRREIENTENIGIDEKSFAKGHDYISILYDLDQSRVLDVEKDRTQEAAERLLDTLSGAEQKKIKAVAMDMWKAYETAVSTKLPNAEIVHDRFHISKHLNEAVDKVRRKEHSTLMQKGDETLKKSRQLWLFNEENLSKEKHDLFKSLKNQILKTSRAWGIKELFRDFWTYKSATWAEKFFKRWYNWASHSRLAPIVKTAKMIKRHIENLLTYFRHPVTNAIAEGFNSKIQSIKSAARGFRKFKNYRTRILFFCGKLNLKPKLTH